MFKFIKKMIEINIRELNERINQESSFIDLINIEMNKVIVGQKYMIDRLLIGLLANGHILLEGVPGLAKTLAIKSLANVIDAKFNRIQFTPDLLPADLIGTLIYSQKTEEFIVRQGGRYLLILFLQTKLTVRQLRYKALCWSQCRSCKLLSANRPINYRSLFFSYGYPKPD